MAVVSAPTDLDLAAYADAHRAALLAGDASGMDPMGEAVLLALVARSAADTASWIETRLPGGAQRLSYFNSLASELRARDAVGRTLRQIEKQLQMRAKQLVKSVALGGTTPLWAGAVISGVIGVGALIIHIGKDAGETLVLLLALWVALHAFPPVRVATWRAFTKVPGFLAESGKFVAAVPVGIASAFALSSTVGKEASRILTANVGPVATRLGREGELRKGTNGVLVPVRAVATTVTTCAVLALLAGLVLFGVGVYRGIAHQAQQCTDQYGNYNNCGITTPQ